MADEPIESVRRALTRLPKTGDAGFEGLIQTALSAWTGRKFYGSRGGRQEGRDGGTGPGPLDIVFEAKRYEKPVLVERELLGELIQATQPCPTLDLYVVVTTAATGELTYRALSQLAEDKGIELLVLDWALEEVPTLAAFLAHVRDTVADWFRRYAPSVPTGEIDEALKTVATRAQFEIVTSQIRSHLSSDMLGQSTLQIKIRDTLRLILGDRTLARRKFYQFLSPLAPDASAIDRPRFTQIVESWWAAGGTRKLLAVLGHEGAGKSWIVPLWWRGLPIELARALVIIPSWRLRAHTDAKDGYTLIADSIAWLIADTADEKAVTAIEKRLRRWAARSGDRAEWLVVLDGANEATLHAWAGTIDNLAPLAERLGLRIVATSRSEFWRADVQPRLSAFETMSLPVEDYDDDELRRALALRHINPDDIGTQVKEVIRNPRLLSVAGSLLSTLGAGELTRDRILYTYWKDRMRERGNLVVHNDADIRDLIIEHAKEILAGVKEFAVAGWRRHSGAGKRLTPTQIQDDLSEIVDGQFFQTIGQSYMPRERAFPYMMGLLLLEELKRVGTEDIGKAVDDAVDRIRGFDRAAEILGSATALSLIEGADSVSLALFERWLGLQNVDDEAFEDIAAYVPANPKIYLELLETLYSHGDHPRKEWIAEALRIGRDRARVSKLLIEHLTRWMGTWCPNDERLQLFGDDSQHGRVIRDQNDQRRQRIRGAIASLTKEERDLFERICPEVANAHLPQITRAISHIAAGWRLSPLAEGVLALSLTAEICDRHIFHSGLDWLFDANCVDFVETRAALLKVADKALAIAQSRAVNNAVGRTYCFAGLPEDIRKFSAIFKFPPEIEPFRHGWHWLQDFCDSDPLDPNSPKPTNLAKAEVRIGALSGDKVNFEFSMTLEQHHVVGLTGALARFNPVPIYSLWRRALDTLPTRDGLALRQFSLALPQVSPLLKPEDIAAIEAHLFALNNPSHSLNAKGNSFVPTKLLEAIAPHLEGNAQLELLVQLREVGEQVGVRLADQFKAADPLRYETHLTRAFENSQDALMAVLLFATTGKQPLTAHAAETITKCLPHANQYVRCLAFQIAWRTQDASLLNSVRNCDWSYNSEGVSDREAFYGSRALALAAANSDEPVPFARISSELWSYACGCSKDGPSLDKYTQLFERLAERMVGNYVEVPAPSIIRHSDEGTERHYPFFERDLEAEEKSKDPIEAMERFSRGFDPEAWAREDELFRVHLHKITKALINRKSLFGVGREIA